MIRLLTNYHKKSSCSSRTPAAAAAAGACLKTRLLSAQANSYGNSSIGNGNELLKSSPSSSSSAANSNIIFVVGRRNNPTRNYKATYETRRNFSSAPMLRTQETFVNSVTGPYVEAMYSAWQKDPSSVHISWQAYFKNISGSPAGSTAGGKNNAFTAPPNLIPSTLKFMTSDGLDSPSSTLSQDALLPSGEILDTMKVQLMVRAFQVRGHQRANLDPLGITTFGPKHAPELSPAHYGFGEGDLDRKFFLGSGILPKVLEQDGKKQRTLREIVKILTDTYCGTIAIEYGHIPEREQCDWLRSKFEHPTKYRYSKDEKLAILDRLMWSDHFEKFVSTKFPSEKRFGLEGCESLIPGMKALVDTSVDLGANSVVMGMPHRGRLNVLANVVRKPHASIFSEFSATQDSNVEGSGDVKYHLGMNYARPTPSGKIVHLSLAANPSHLEAVDPVVLGKVRGIQFFQHDEEERKQSIPVLLHGDAAFAAQGIVYETLGFTHLPNYTTGGTIHLIVNNQIGFTTDPRFARSTPYCSDVAKTVNAPIVHVNGDDTEAVVFACQLAAEWRAKYHSDFVVDIVCYRKYGHNEIDQPGFTQPRMYQRISKMVPVFEKYSQQLLSEGIISQSELDQMKKKVWDILEADFTASKNYKPTSAEWVSSSWAGFKSPAELRKETTAARATGVDKALLDHIGIQSCSYPPDFNPHPNLARILKGRAKTIQDGDGIDWATAEAMAFGSLLGEGNHVRLSGQDVERGTFSQRHALLHDQNNEKQFVPLNNLVRAGALSSQSHFTVCNSSLSEFGTLGFELGYSLVTPSQLTIWEAQFGDFANNAQCIIDQFIASGEQKWLQRSGLTMLLPHGYDGQGPEHSSARIERFLQLCDEDPYHMPDDKGTGLDSASRQHQDCNMQVIYPTVPSNYFHALRRQVHRDFRKPLIVFTSKALLRHPLAKSAIGEMAADSRFQRLIPEVLHPNALASLQIADPSTGISTPQYAGNTPEPRIPFSAVKDVSYPLNSDLPLTIAPDAFTLLPPSEIKTLIFCSGQVYYLLSKARAMNNLRHVAIVRIEQLNPFPFWEAKTVIDFYANSLEEVVYCQEESFNSGSWSFVEPRLTTAIEHSDWYKTDKAKEWKETFNKNRCSGGLENARCDDSLNVSIRGGHVLRYAGRDISAAPATGIKKQHKFEEKMLLSEALLNGKLVYPPARIEGDVPIFF